MKGLIYKMHVLVFYNCPDKCIYASLVLLLA